MLLIGYVEKLIITYERIIIQEIPLFFFFGRRKKRKTYLGDIRASTPRHCGKASVYQHGQHQTFAIRFFLQRSAKGLGDWSLLHRHISSVQIIFHFRGTFTFSSNDKALKIERTSSFSRFIVETIKPGYFSDRVLGSNLKSSHLTNALRSPLFPRCCSFYWKNRILFGIRRENISKY